MQQKFFRNKIAVICGEPYEEYQAEIIRGISSVCMSYNTNLHILCTYSKHQDSIKRELGENSVLDVINPEDYQGIIVLGDTIFAKNLLGEMEKKIYKTGYKNVLFLDSKSRYYPSISVNHKAPFKSLAEYILKNTSKREIVFLNGKEGHEHSVSREKGFYEAMLGFGIPVRRDSIFYGDFWFSGGENFVDNYLSSGRKLPEIVICANDYMAFGVIRGFERNGIRVPEDVLVSGYDFKIKGRPAEIKLTSLKVNYTSYGKHSAELIFNGIDQDSNSNDCFCPSFSIFTGDTSIKDERNFENADLDYFNMPQGANLSMDYNLDRMLEDSMSASVFSEAMEIIKTYTYQIRPFTRFNIFVNPDWAIKDNPITITDRIHDKVVNVLSCDEVCRGMGTVSYDSTVDIKEAFQPPFTEDKKATVTYYSSLFFDNSIYGMASVSYDDPMQIIDLKYVYWLKRFMFILEIIKRSRDYKKTAVEISESKYTDRLTGLYNYDGFLSHLNPILDAAQRSFSAIGIVAVDIVGISEINSKYGRHEGDDVIRNVANMLMEASGDGAIGCRLGNDEIVSAKILSENSPKAISSTKRKFLNLLKKYNNTKDYRVLVAIGGYGDRQYRQKDIENLIGVAVSVKNGNKVKRRREEISSINEKQKKDISIVNSIIDNNEVGYHFQPIVDAKNGDIVAYEALMRPTVTPYFGPQSVIDYAIMLNRLMDVERLTFNNVLRIVDEKKNELMGKKVFINSIPGSPLEMKTEKDLLEKIKKVSYAIVIEFTEHTEADEYFLNRAKSFCKENNIAYALDDYGTGYSNAVNLINYMPNYVKVDRMLLSGIEKNKQKQHFVKEVIKFAHDNNFKVIAEGVETLSEMNMSISLGADFLQGYYLARPEAEMIKNLKTEVINEIVKSASSATA